MNSEHHDVVVIGGGQAGLAIGYHLAQQGRRFTILDAGTAPAAAWRSRWDSLKLFTPARYDSLPGLSFPGDPDRYPTRDEVVAYLTGYARHFELPVELDSRVTALHAAGGGYRIELADRVLEPRPLLPRDAVAAHARIGTAGLGQGRRRAHRTPHDERETPGLTGDANRADEPEQRGVVGDA